MNDHLFRLAKKHAAEKGKTFTSLVEDALRSSILRKPEKNTSAHVRLPTFKGRGTLPGVNLDSTAELVDLMDDI